MSRDVTASSAKIFTPAKRGSWSRLAFACTLGWLGMTLLAGCSVFQNNSSRREPETIYKSDATQKRGFFSPATGPKTTKQFLSGPRVPLPPQS